MKIDEKLKNSRLPCFQQHGMQGIFKNRLSGLTPGLTVDLHEHGFVFLHDQKERWGNEPHFETSRTRQHWRSYADGDVIGHHIHEPFGHRHSVSALFLPEIFMGSTWSNS